LARGDPGATLTWLESASKIHSRRAPGVSNPHIPPAHKSYGLELRRQRRHADAARALEEARQLTPKRLLAVAGLARARAAL
jgi:hypothetical protein